MRSITLVGILSVLILACPPEGLGQKLQSSFSSDTLDQNNQAVFKPQPPTPQTTTATSVPIVSAPASPPNTLTVQTTMPKITQAPFPPAAPEIPASALPNQNLKMPRQMTNPWDLKTPKISVPDNERKWQAMLQQQQAKAAKKKKTLAETILEELVKYGMLITLGLVVLVVIYAVRKEPQKAGDLPAHPKGEESKKDIWHEDF